jgi:methylenetetrahydrofolate reductase (NADPH)
MKGNKIESNRTYSRSKRKTLFSFEIIPPQKGKVSQNYMILDPLMGQKPFIDVTTSQKNLYVDKGNGLLDKTNQGVQEL